MQVCENCHYDNTHNESFTFYLAIGGGRGQWLGGTMANEMAEHEPITGVWGQSLQRGPGVEPLVRGSEGEAPLKLKAFWSLDVQRSRQM